MTKKGLAGGYPAQIAAVGASWSYIWYPARDRFHGSFEHVPMIKTGFDAATVRSIAVAHPASYWLFFNEPDFYGGDGYLKPLDAAKVYHDATAIIGSVAPAARFIVGGLFWPNNLPWLDQFREAYAATYGALPNVHGWHVHAYAEAQKYTTQQWRDTLTPLKGWVAAKTPGAEVWVTEFGCLQSDEVGKRVMQEQIPWLEAQTWITRYAWYTSYSSSRQGSLFAGDASTVKTALGNLYTTFGGAAPEPPFTPPPFVDGIRRYSDPAIAAGCHAVLEFGNGTTVAKRFVCQDAAAANHRSTSGGVTVTW
jgi:hypothetical protein